MRQWSVDGGSDGSFSPFSPCSPRTTNGSLRSLPTNVERPGARKVTAAFAPCSPASWRPAQTDRDVAPRPSHLLHGGSFSFDSVPPHRPWGAHSQSDTRLLSSFDGPVCPSGEEEEEEVVGRAAQFGANSRGPWEGDSARDDEEEEMAEGSQRGLRLSRHIPQREGMDMSVSAFNLLEQEGQANEHLQQQQQQQQQHRQPRRHSAALRTSVASLSPGATASTAVSFTTTFGPAGSLSQPPAGAGGGASNSNNNLSTTSLSSPASFSDSFISDDSSYMTALYNDRLAAKLTHYNRHGPGAATGAIPALSRSLAAAMRRVNGGDAARMGRRAAAAAAAAARARCTIAQVPSVTVAAVSAGEVFRFGGGSANGSPRSAGRDGSGNVSADRRRQHPSSGSPVSVVGDGMGISLAASARLRHPRVGSGSEPHGSPRGRVLCPNPERVLDAPEFPANNTAHLIDWGSNNKLVIGLKSTVYAWDAETGQAGKLVQLQGGLEIDCVQWLHKCACLALSIGGSTTAIYDCRSEDFIRTVRLPAGLGVTGIAVNGPIMAVSSNGPTGLTQSFDLRAKNALVATYDGHSGAVTSMQYCGADPYYLATGGQDGHVRVWDSRRSQAMRYAYDSVHQGPVAALHWNPDRRSRLFTGGDDGVLCHIDTHAAARAANDNDEDSVGIDGPASSFVLGVGAGGSSGSSAFLASPGSSTVFGVKQSTAQSITRAVKSMYPISGMAVHNGEIVTSHRGNGQLQLRKASSFQLLGTFTSPNCTQSLSCLVLSPDRQVVCAAQEDETLKFWRVFEAATDGDVPRNTRSGRRDVRLPMHHDPVSRLEDQLR